MPPIASRVVDAHITARRVGRPTRLEQQRREQQLLQLVAAGHSWRAAATLVGVAPVAVLRLQERIGVGMPARSSA
jgi:hypothetical protein